MSVDKPSTDVHNNHTFEVVQLTNEMIMGRQIELRMMKTPQGLRGKAAAEPLMGITVAVDNVPVHILYRAKTQTSDELVEQARTFLNGMLLGLAMAPSATEEEPTTVGERDFVAHYPNIKVDA